MPYEIFIESRYSSNNNAKKKKEQEKTVYRVLLFLSLFCQITTKGLHYLKDMTEDAWAGATSHEK